VRVLLNRQRDLAGLLGGEVRPVRQAAGEHRQQGDPVSQDIMHLQSDLGPFRQFGLLDPLRLFALRGQCRLSL
jgi:hypothetical protein